MSIDTTAVPTGAHAVTAPKSQIAVNDIGTEEDFLAAIDKTIKYFNDGDIVEGTIVKVDRDEVLLDIGYKTEGVIPSRELSIKHDVDPSEVVAVGDEVEALVLQKEDKEGRLILSKKRAQYERAWGTIEALKDKDEPVKGTVIEVVKGGLILDIGLRGFLPASLVEMRRVRDLQPYVGRELEAKIIELDKNRNNVVLSRRAWLEQTQSEVRSEFLNQLQKGQVRKGVVSSIVNFGAFVDLGGVDGLVHVSELSWKHIDHPSEVVEVGTEVTVEVLDVDMERERVSLSLKATQEDPWRQFARTHAIGQIVPGKVTKLVPFGAFVRVEEGIEGLVHISELAERHVEIPEQVVQVNDDVMVKVIDIDLERRRISLSLKQANEGFTVESEFDPTQYGMAAEYDPEGNYIYPEGFDPETNDWKEGFDKQREEWERQYAEAQQRYNQHIKQIVKAAEAEAEAAAGGDAAEVPADGAATAGAVGAAADGGSYSSGDTTGGTLASDEQLAALREKLSGGV
jgi:small subunit ribosomal protein S1